MKSPDATEGGGMPSPMAWNVADLLVHYIEQIGVNTVFGVPGSAIEPVLDAIARSRRRGGLELVVARHESGAAFMADAWSRETGLPGVCLSGSGPAATNMMTGVANAADNRIPLLAITGQAALPMFGRHPLQASEASAIDIPGIYGSFCCYSSLLSHPDQAEVKISAALLHACRASCPAHIAIPVDIQRSLVTRMPGAHLEVLSRPPRLVDEEALRELLAILADTAVAAVVLGPLPSVVMPRMMQFVEKLGVPFITTPDAKGLINPGHPLYRGVIGYAGHPEAMALLRPAQGVILAFGLRVSEWRSGGWSPLLLNDRLIHIDEREANLLGTPMARLHVQGNVSRILASLLENVLPGPGGLPAAAKDSLAARRMMDWPPANRSGQASVPPSSLMDYLSARLPSQVRVVADAGNSAAWAVNRLHVAERRDSGRHLRAPGVLRDSRYGDRSWLRVLTDFAPMGWAIAASVGYAIADPLRPTLCLTGDGSLLMNGQEMTVALALNLPVIWLVLNDASLGMVRHGQQLARAESIGHALPPVDFAAMARAMGLRAFSIPDIDALQAFDPSVFAELEGPCLIDVHIDPDEVPPIGARLPAQGGIHETA